LKEGRDAPLPLEKAASIQTDFAPRVESSAAAGKHIRGCCQCRV